MSELKPRITENGIDYCRLAHPAAKVAVFGVCVHQKAVRHPAKADEPPRCGEHRE